MIKESKKKKKSKLYSSAYSGNVNPQADVDFFNFHSGTGVEAAASTCESPGLTEGKRYVRRYYIKPYNVFCSNKAEILMNLIDHLDEDCVIYTLNNLGDEKDVSKLTANDIIFYYEDSILYDKNHVRIMDYKLNIKNEENRDRVDVDKTSDSRLNDIYDDRLTDLNNLEENAINEFDLDFPSLSEAKKNVCCICGEEIDGYGNNAEPYASGRCCDACNMKFVIPSRIDAMQKGQSDED